MNILLTGGAGCIGSHAAVALERAGHQVALYDNFSNSNSDVERYVVEIVGHPITVTQRDVASTNAKVDTAAQLLGWTSQRGLDEMCASAWRYQCKLGGQLEREQK